MKAKSIIPAIGYKDAPKAIEWLCNAFGFEKRQVYASENGLVEHAQLTLGNVMIMLHSVKIEGHFSKFIKHPADIGNVVTQGPYIVLNDEDIEAHYQKAKEQGADIIYDLKAEEYGGKNYTCLDPEGHLWSFGSYDPWEIPSSF